MTLREQRCLFTQLISQQVLDMIAAGYEVAYDEVTERLTEKDQSSDHMRNSLHHVGLAADLLLYKNGSYLTLSEYHKESGDMWKARHPLCRWGGDFKNKNGQPQPDGNHYSLEYQNRE